MVMLILASIPCPGFTHKVARLSSCPVIALLFFIAALVCSAYSSYWLIIKYGMDMSGIKGCAVSLTLIPLLAWMIKRRFLRKEVELADVLAATEN